MDFGLLFQIRSFAVYSNRVRPSESSWHVRSFEDNCIRALRVGLGTFELSFRVGKRGVKRIRRR